MRRIQSFVRRAGRKNKTASNAWEALWSLYGLELSVENFMPLEAVFGRSAETIVEIGFGDGRSLLEMAKRAPEKNFLGIEVYRTGIGTLLAAVEKEKLCNMRILHADALEALAQLSDGSLTTIQLFFPDPWPKTRHHKRRLVQPGFLNLCAKKLKIGGTLHMATDWEAYAMHMMGVVSAHQEFQNPAGEGQFLDRPAFRPVSKYETRGLKLGHQTWDLIVHRTTL